MRTNLVVTFFISFLLFTASFSYCQSDGPSTNKKIVVFGSSVAAGWVSSYEEQYDFKNGYAYRLERFLADKGFTVVNKSIPGDGTKLALERFDADVLSEDPDFVFIGLSMSNEGLETENPDSVSLSFETGMKKIIQKCVGNEIYPVLGCCYANDNFTPEQYEYLKKMNISMNSWGYPCVNFLGALNDGKGNFPAGTTFDPNHPDNSGHEEFFLAFNPGLFEMLATGKKLPSLVNHNSSTKIGKVGKYERIFYVPGEPVHSFSFGFDFKINTSCRLAEIISMDSSIEIIINDDGIMSIEGLDDQVKSKSIGFNTWNSMLITHSYPDSRVNIYLDDKRIGEIKGQIESAAFITGDASTTADYKDLYIYRSALNANEIAANNESLVHASLAFYSPLKKGEINNLAQNNTFLISDKESAILKIEEIKTKIINAAKIRNSELKVKRKTVVEVDPAIYNAYAGKYYITEDDYFLVETENNKLYFTDRGRKAEILPEAENRFFIHYPGEITFTFEKDDSDRVIKLIANYNGYILEGKKK